jgi:nicotinamidase-related amidase
MLGMTAALFLVDVQRNMLDGDEPVPDAAAVSSALADLLVRARAAGAVVVHVQNDGEAGDPDEPETPGWELVFPPEPGEAVLRKNEQDTLAAHPHLSEELRAAGVTRVVVAGMQSEYCISATSRGLIAAGFDVTLAAGAHATYDQGRPAAALSADVETALAAEGVTVTPADAVTFEG